MCVTVIVPQAMFAANPELEEEYILASARTDEPYGEEGDCN